ncbi:MAG: hypothetical protein ACJA08_001949 [Cyclobacteriaceae bacterium]|jgi:hypothetical protein
MLNRFNILSILLFLGISYACENKDLNEGEAFQPREIHENISFNFDKIKVDGIEYLILEKDNNNPHEGFGFMALRGNVLMEKQDTILAYLKTITELQNQILASTTKKSIDQVRNETEILFQIEMKSEELDLEKLEKSKLKSDSRK